MQRLSRIFFRAGLLVTACALAWQIQPASAACASEDPKQPLFIKATPASKCARYYAPYALQAAAAYIAVADFDSTLRDFHISDNPALRGGDPSLNGSDVERALQPYGSDVAGRARQYLRAWQYQFGSESYLTCYDTSDANCMKSYNESGVQPFFSGPAFQVWARTHVVPVAGDPDRIVHVEHAACSEVSIAFRGTVGLSAADWVTSAEPVTEFANKVRSFVLRRKYETDDYYHQLQRNIDAVIKRITTLDCYRNSRHPQIVSVGHSLGGALAQFAALAVTKGPRIAKVFAFDSSPVIAAGLIDPEVRNGNAAELEIDRVYQSGEGLSQYVNPVVSRLQFAGVYSDCKPLVRYVAYDAVPGSNPINLHSVREGAGLAAKIVGASWNDETQFEYKPPHKTGCKTQYNAPASDDDTTPVPKISLVSQNVYVPADLIVANAPADSVVANAVGRRKAINLSRGEQNFTNAHGMWLGDRLVAAPPTAKKGRRVHTARL